MERGDKEGKQDVKEKNNMKGRCGRKRGSPQMEIACETREGTMGKSLCQGRHDEQ